jgi:hypothetical protein
LTLILILLTGLLLFAAVIGVELARLFGSTRRPSDLSQLKTKFAGFDFYRPIERAFSEDDMRFLNSRGALTSEARKQLLRSRSQIMRLYMRQFRSDFYEAWGVCRLLAPFSDDPNFGVNLVKQMVTFYRLYSVVQFRLLVYGYRPADMALTQLVEQLRRVRQVAYETLASVEDLAVQPMGA